MRLEGPADLIAQEITFILFADGGAVGLRCDEGSERGQHLRGGGGAAADAVGGGGADAEITFARLDEFHKCGGVEAIQITCRADDLVANVAGGIGGPF